MDLMTTYMGLKLANPIVPSASPLSQEIDTIRQMEDAGAGAVVLWSLFEEQFEYEENQLEHYLHYGADRFAESLTYFPQPKEFHLPPERYLEHIRAAKEATGIPIIASLNGVSAGGWVKYAKEIEQAGADGLELNIYFMATNPKLAGKTVEAAYLALFEAVKSTVKIPVAVKLSPYFSSTANMAAQLDAAGADALVLFNRFYQPDINIQDLEVRPRLVLSSSVENRLPMRWIAILRPQVRCSLAASTGIHTAEDAAKMILAGADVTMMCSALMRHGISHITQVRAGLVAIMEEKEYTSVQQMKGVLDQKNCPEPSVFERANYMKTLQSYGWTATLE